MEPMPININVEVISSEELKKYIELLKEIQEEYHIAGTLNVTVVNPCFLN